MDSILQPSLAACATASTKPWSELGAKYTRMLACGARAAASSTSRSTSPSGPLPPLPSGALPLAAVDSHGGQLDARNALLLQVLLDFSVLVAAPQFDNADCLARRPAVPVWGSCRPWPRRPGL